MNSTQAVSVLKREKELLEDILAMAECQPDLLESGRAEDLEILLSLRLGPLSQLNAAEETFEAQSNGIPATDDLRELYELNVSILGLVDRILNYDQKTAHRLRQICEKEGTSQRRVRHARALPRKSFHRGKPDSSPR
jgi:hypothetical protein